MGSNFDLIALLSEHNVEFKAPQPSPWSGLSTLLSWVVPPLIFVGIWAWFLRGTQGMGASALTLGKSKARIYAEGDTGVTFNDVAESPEADQRDLWMHPDRLGTEQDSQFVTAIGQLRGAIAARASG